MITADNDENEPCLSNCSICNMSLKGKSLSCQLCKCKVHKSCVDKEALIDIDHCFHCQKCADGPIPFYTCWISLSEVDVSDSVLGFIPKTHLLKGFDRPLKDHQVRC